MIHILSVAITTFQEKTWGRVYVQYEKDNQLFYAFKNWIKFEENTYFGAGNLENEPAYTWFLKENRHIFKTQTVLDGEADSLMLTPQHHKEKFGIPSVILKRLLIEIRANAFQKVENRRGWYDRSQLEDIKISPIRFDDVRRTIVFTDYEMEIKLQPKQYLVYRFYSMHPEGVYRNELPDYERELKELYTKISVSTVEGKNDKILAELIDLTSNSWDEQLSKIKKTFIETLGEEIAQHYWIKGSKGEKYYLSF